MTATTDTIGKIEDQILRSDATICRHIKNLDSAGRGAVSQDILSNLRTFVEHVMLRTIKDSITILGKTMPIYIITDWVVAIRPVEIERFSNVFGGRLQRYAGSAEGRGLMQYLTRTGFNLVELISFGDEYYQHVRSKTLTIFDARVSHLFDLFDRCRDIIKYNRPGANIVRYLLYHMNNTVITDQLGNANGYLSDLCLEYGCIPFEKMPFCTSLKNHNPRVNDLFDCLDVADRVHELLARSVVVNSERNG